MLSVETFPSVYTVTFIQSVLVVLLHKFLTMVCLSHHKPSFPSGAGLGGVGKYTVGMFQVLYATNLAYVFIKCKIIWYSLHSLHFIQSQIDGVNG